MKNLIFGLGVIALLSIGCKKADSALTKVTPVDSTEVDSLVYDSTVVSHKQDTILIDSTTIVGVKELK